MCEAVRRTVTVAGAVLVVSASVAGTAMAKAAPPVLAFSPAPYDYQQITVGQAASQVFTLKNTGGSASADLAVTVPGAAAFTVTADGCSGTSLGPGKSCTVTVRFKPAAAGSMSATLTAAGKKSAATATDVLSGTGTVPGHLYWTNVFSGTVVEAALCGRALGSRWITRIGTGRAVALTDAGREALHKHLGLVIG